MSGPICKMSTTYYGQSEEVIDQFRCITLQETLRKELEYMLRRERRSEEVHQYQSKPKLLNLFPLTPDLQPFKLHESATTSSLVRDTKGKQIVEDTKGKQIVASRPRERPRELVTGGLLLHIDYKPCKKPPTNWQVNFPNVSDNIAQYVNVMLGCRCDECNEILTSLNII